MSLEKDICDGITSCIKRHAIADNPHMGPLCDSSKESTYLTYLDANNLYGYSMSQSMPEKDFKWMSRKKIDKFDVMSISDDNHTGYILGCDIGYHIHDEHCDLPFLPERQCPEWSKNAKLLTTFKNKYNYVCHYRNLRQALSNGLVINKVHRILKLKASD